MTLKLSGKKTATGIEITCVDVSTPFRMEFQCREIKPLSRDRARWSIDGAVVELEASPARALMGRVGAKEDLPAPRPLHSQEGQGWTSGSESETAGPRGQRVWAWTIMPPAGTGGQPLRVMATRLGNTDILVSAELSRPPSELEPFLKATILSAQPAEVAKNTEDDARVRDVKGVSLERTLVMQESLTGDDYRAIANAQLVNEQDAGLPIVVVTPGASLIKLAQRMLVRHDAILAQVFDGHFSHSVTLRTNRDGTSAMHYWDPWGEGSFLDAEHNEAGVAATPHPTERRIWTLPAEQMERVLYAVVVPESVLFEELEALGESPSGPACDDSLLGLTADEATSKDFFKFFHLKEVARGAGEGGTTNVEYRPSAPLFKPHVRVRTRSAKDGRIGTVELTVTRTFLFDRANMVFALDIIRSFARAVMTSADGVKLARFLYEVHKLPRLALNEVHETAKDATIQLPHVPSRELLALLGAAPARTATADSMTMHIGQVNDPDMGPGVQITAAKL